MKKTYSKPFIARRQMGISSKFVDQPGGQYQDNIDGIPVNDLVDAYGSPLFVYSYKSLKSIYNSAYRAFSKRYPKVHFAWSYKTNYLKAVCQSYHNLGSWAEVVSDWEYELAREMGVPGEKIVYNGPYKTAEGLRRAVNDGAMINIDSFDEIYDLEKIADELNREVAIGMRVNMKLTALNSWDRFGLNLDTGQALEAVKRIVSGKQLRLRGIHSHVGTFVLSADVYREQVTRMVAFAQSIRESFGVKIEYIDIGGGFPSHNKLKDSIYPMGQHNIPSFDDFAEAICPPLLQGFPADELPTLLLETGRGLVDETAHLISSVVATKRLSSGQRMLVLDGGVNLLFTAFWYDPKILPTEKKNHLSQEPHHIYGPLCMQIDQICNSVTMPYLEKGDRVVIHPVGAYNNSQWMQFIQLRPNVVMIGEENQISVIRDAEFTDYVRQLEHLPEWLQKKAESK